MSYSETSSKLKIINIGSMLRIIHRDHKCRGQKNKHLHLQQQIPMPENLTLSCTYLDVKNLDIIR